MSNTQLAGGTYEILRNRLRDSAGELRSRLARLNTDRNEVFGNIETKLIATQRITTEHNCIARDIVAVGDHFLFGYNVQFGLKTDIHLPDVFSVHQMRDHEFHNASLQLLEDPNFIRDFEELYRFYKGTTFLRFFVSGPILHMVFQVGRTATDIKSFKWRIVGSQIQYVDNRSDHEVKRPPQHAFTWKRATRDMHRYGEHPHISIDDRVFIETVGGDLTVKVENNTSSGEGIYAEPVDNPDQKLDDAEVYYAVVGNLVMMKVKPYQENAFRYLVFSGKINQAVRLDEIQHACVMLPGDQGVIFPGGYYLQSGEFKRFEHGLVDMRYERTIASSNGEDYLYLFSNLENGTYIQLRYNQIRQCVETPLVCHGQTFFEAGEMVCFKTQEVPQKHHPIQIWQTPFVGENFLPESQTDSLLFKIGNKDLVRGMAECSEVLHLIEKDDNYDGLYEDLVKKSGDVLDSYFWIAKQETHRLDEPLTGIRDAATAAVDEFEKVVRARAQTQQQTVNVQTGVEKLLKEIERSRFAKIHDFVDSLSQLREHRGHAIALKDLKFSDAAISDLLEQQLIEATERLSRRCVEFLLAPDSLAPYHAAIAEVEAKISSVATVAVAKQIEGEIDQSAAQLEMLTETVSNLQIEDATQRTEIIDAIGDVLAVVNRVRSALKNRRRKLVGSEGRAEFASQMKLLQQTTTGYLDVCDTSARCDEYLTKVMVSIEELEGRFAEFDEFIETLSERREEIYAAFESRRVAILEQRNRRAESLGSAAERILKSIASRISSMSSTDEIAAYFAGDLMVAKIRSLIDELDGLGDAIRVGDLQGRLKVLREDATRGLKDRQDLFENDGDVIRLGRRRFAVNLQPLDLTTVVRGGMMCLHLTGTQFFEPMLDDRLESARDLWDQPLVSESRHVYRAEFLAIELFSQARDRAELSQHWIAEQMSGRLEEGYAKGVHDVDTEAILDSLLTIDRQLGLLRYEPSLRIASQFWWHFLVDEQRRSEMGDWIAGFAKLARAYADAKPAAEFRQRLMELAQFDADVWGPVFESSVSPSRIADYLFEELVASSATATISGTAHRLYEEFARALPQVDRQKWLASGLQANAGDPIRSFILARNWVDAFLEKRPVDKAGAVSDRFSEYRDEIALLVLCGHGMGTDAVSTADRFRVHDVPVTSTVSGLVGSHERIVDGKLILHYHEFMRRLREYREDVVPRYRALHQAKAAVIATNREAMRLDEFKPKVLSSFVRNQLLDEVYLPLIGDNLAKQMGTAGEDKRTDRMGLLLLISPPGYGKTTLMEYVANRLGLVFMKINGPAIGHAVTSLDPAEAPNAAAREEIERLNFALEMGDNVMLYLDDIQHTHPELLQKFISLCDATRKIEGVRGGKTRTYDLRGRRVAVVMAGNPYTESGDRFQIPDMLSNRADVYNLGEIIGDQAAAFEMSYLENCLSSNTTLAPLSTAPPADARRIMLAAERNSIEGTELESNFSLDQIRDMFDVARKLLRVRDVVLRVNRAYIRSAAQADAYRTEPPFKLQGSYRNMNRIAERVAPVMNDAELQTLIVSNYEQDAQTLTTDNEANMLKFKELMGVLTSEESQRWEAIKYAYVESVRMSGLDNDDHVGQMMRQLAAMRDGLESIRKVIAQAVTTADQARQLPAPPIEQKVLVQHKVPRVMAELIKGQFHLMQEWMRPLLKESIENGRDIDRLLHQLDEMMRSYQDVQKVLQSEPESGSDAQDN